MNYTDLLSDEEKIELCEVITGGQFKEYFKNNGNAFSKIKKGYRAKTLSEQQALAIAEANVKTPFIASLLNSKVEIWLKEIQGNIYRLENEGMPHDTAAAETLLDSVFDDHVDLYFKLAGDPLDETALSELRKGMEWIHSERERKSEAKAHTEVMQEENRCLSEQIEAEQQRINVLEEEHRKKISEIEQEKKDLETQLTEAQEEIAELKNPSAFFGYDDGEYLVSFDDTDNSLLTHGSSNEIISLCEVIYTFNGQKWLIRHADLNYNGCYSIFHRNEESDPYFENRDRIFYKDGPSDEGFYGIWTWSAIPNMKDSSKDYISSRYNAGLSVIEIAFIAEALTLDELACLLKEGVEYRPHSNKILFSVCMSRGQYTGILCSMKKLRVINGKVKVAEDCIEVPVYEFSESNVVRLENGFSFYKKAFVGIPERLYHLKSPLEIVKGIVLSSISWDTCKSRGATRDEYRALKKFVGTIPTDDITQQIGETCHCSSAAAEKLLDEFLSTAWKYIEGNSLEDAIILSAVSASTELEERTKALIRVDWETENRKLLTEAQDKLDSLCAEANAVAAKLAEMQESYNKIKAEEEDLTVILTEKKKLAEGVEEAVADRIRLAQENAADFIANMAFVNAQPKQTAVPEFSAPVTVEVPAESLSTLYHTVPLSEDLSDLEAHDSWESVISSAAFELEEAGVTGKYAKGLAAFLCAAYIEKQPILLVGPNAIDIVEAFCAAATGHKHGVLYCEGSYDCQAVKKIGADGENIVMINNLFTAGWMNRLPELLSDKDIFYISTHPYAEDIQVEPKSLFGFMLPLFTEFFVDKKASGNYYGGYFADDFVPYEPLKSARKDLKILSKFKLSPLVKNRINLLASTMQGVCPAATADDTFLFLVLPIAYASMEMDKLTEAVGDTQKEIGISADLKRELKYVLGEA